MKIQTLEERGGAKWKDFDRGGDAELLFFFVPLDTFDSMGIASTRRFSVACPALYSRLTSFFFFFNQVTSLLSFTNPKSHVHGL